VALDFADDDMQLAGGNSEAVGKALRLAAALLLCSRGRISTGRAARLAGRTYAGFLEEAERSGVALFDADLEDLRHEVTRPLPEGVDAGAIQRDIERARSARL
jgi:predicted HTH domain antitoxin